MNVIRAPLHYLNRIFGFLLEYMTDMWLHARYSYHSGRSNSRLFYRIVIEAHSVEKGLSLRHPRPLFGATKIKSMLGLLRRYDSTFSPFPVSMADGALREYVQYNEQCGADAPVLTVIREHLHSSDCLADRATGGVKMAAPMTGVRDQRAIDFLKARTSCRAFAPLKIEAAAIAEVVALAQAAPSQCNRQGSKVHIYQDRATIDALLMLQSGAKGFADTVENLFVVTNEISAWGGPQQRNQMYVDGALFAMMLMLALEAHGYASVPLNLAVTNSTESKIKRVGSIPANERLIMMIAFGVSEGASWRAARSPRRAPSEIAAFH